MCKTFIVSSFIPVQYYFLKNVDKKFHTDTVQNTTTVEIHNTTQEGESTTDDIEQLQSVQKVTFSKTDSTKNSKASGK